MEEQREEKGEQEFFFLFINKRDQIILKLEQKFILILVCHCVHKQDTITTGGSERDLRTRNAQ